MDQISSVADSDKETSAQPAISSLEGAETNSLMPAIALGFTAMAAVQSASALIAGNDGYYHVKMAELLPELGFAQTFPWLRWTILNENFVSHHYGFHVLLLPFVAVAKYLGFEPALGGKIAACVAMSATFGMFYYIIRRRSVPYPLLWTLALAIVPWHFWLRMSYIRAPMAALPLLLLAVHWCMRGRTWVIFVLAFVFTQVYGGAILFPIIPAGFLLAALAAQTDIKTSIHQLVASISGIVAGLVISPYFPANLSFFFTQLFETGLGAARDVGGEWKPYDAWALLVQAAPLAVVWMACLTLRLRVAVAASRDELGVFFINLAFLVLTLKSRRFVEYWPVFALLHAAECSAVAWSGWSTRIGLQDRAAFRFIAYTAVLALGGWSLWVVRLEQHPTQDAASIRDAMSFLRTNSPSGSLVFTDDWDTFPICFYYNHHNTYIVGLDPEFTRTRYEALWERYRKITRGELPAQLPGKLRSATEPSEIKYEDIGTIFKADYVLVADDHNKLYRALKDRPDSFEMIYPAKSDKQPSLAIFKFLKKGT